MQTRPTAFKAPYFDTYQIGFMRPVAPDQVDRLNWRQRTIAGVSWNGQERTAYFFNPDRLTLPLEAHPYELPLLLARLTVEREFATVVGDGQFAIPAAQQKAMTAKMRGQWVTYWFVDGGTVYGNSAEVFASHTEARATQARDDVVTVLGSVSQHLFWPEHLLWQPDGGQALTQSRQAHIDQQKREAEQSTRAQCAEQHAEQCAYDQRVGEWLRGEAGRPPLLALMQGAA